MFPFKIDFHDRVALTPSKARAPRESGLIANLFFPTDDFLGRGRPDPVQSGAQAPLLPSSDQ
jgi:hypothetical protein